MGFWERAHEAGATELAPGATRRERDRAGLFTAVAVAGLFLGVGALGFGLLGLTVGRHREAERTAITAAQALERAAAGGETGEIGEIGEIVSIEGRLVTSSPVRLPHSRGDLLAGEVRITWRSRDSEKKALGFHAALVAPLAIASGGAELRLPGGIEALPLREVPRAAAPKLVEVEHEGSRTSRTAVAFTYAGSRSVVDRAVFADERMDVEVEARELAPGERAVVTGRVTRDAAGVAWMRGAAGGAPKVELGTLAEIGERKAGTAGGMVAFGLLALGGALWAWRRAGRIRRGWAARGA